MRFINSITEYQMSFKRIIFFIILLLSSNAFAEGVERIVVTGSRINVFDSPAITLVKPADYLIQKIILTNDTRDESSRTTELHKTVKGILKAANKKKTIAIAVGNEIIYPISLDNFQLELSLGSRADTSEAFLYIKTPIKSDSNVEELIEQLNDFIKKTKNYGRTEIFNAGELVLSIINPQKYRNELLKLIAEDLNKTIKIFGDNYVAEIQGISESLQWERESISELKLYLEYDFTLMSK